MKVISGKKYYISDEGVEEANVVKVAKIAICTDSLGVHWFEALNQPESWKFAVLVPEQPKDLKEELIALLTAVAYVGIDFGYGEFALEKQRIKQARELLVRLEKL
jgi:hypothetical protein